MDIDFVMPWVDGNDPAWRKERDQYSSSVCSGDNDVRFRDWELLRYWFRGIEENAPWMHKLHFVTWGHLPKWLDSEHPKLHIVKHTDYIPTQYLPTFSSHVIELNMHRIPGLSEHFVYYNDDTYLINPVTPSDFFHDDLPCDYLVESAITPRSRDFSTILCANASVINDHFQKRDLKRLRGKYFNLKYKKLLMRTISTMPYQYIMGFYFAHICQAFRKQTFEDVWKNAHELLDQTCTHRFRGLNDVNQYLIRDWALCKGEFHPAPPIGKFMRLDMDLRAIQNAILHSKVKCLTLNDSIDVHDMNTVMQAVKSYFQEKFPKKSSFEIDTM